MRYLGYAVALLVAVFAVLFLGGLCSAVLEARRERAAGLPVSRPADELRAKRRARGDGFRGSARIWWRGVRTGIPQCWCGHGTIVWYPAVGSVATSPDSIDGYGCTAAEAWMPQACEIHERAGGYARTPADFDGARVA